MIIYIVEIFVENEKKIIYTSRLIQYGWMKIVPSNQYELLNQVVSNLKKKNFTQFSYTC